MSRWRQIDESLHSCFSATRWVQNKSFKCRHYGYIASSTMCQQISIIRYLQRLRGNTHTHTNQLLSLSVLQQRHIRNYYNHPHLDQAYNVWGVAQHHKCSFFATFWTSWSNLTLTSTLLTNYCKHSIHSSLQANGIFHLFSQHPFLSH